MKGSLYVRKDGHDAKLFPVDSFFVCKVLANNLHQHYQIEIVETQVRLEFNLPEDDSENDLCNCP